MSEEDSWLVYFSVVIAVVSVSQSHELVCGICDCGVYRSFSLAFQNHLAEEETSGYFTLIVFLLSCDGQCYMFLPRGAVSWSVVCDCGIYRSYTLAFCSHLAGKETAGYFTLRYNCRVAVCVLCLFLEVRRVGLSSVIVAISGHTHLLFAVNLLKKRQLVVLLFYFV